MRCCCNGGGSGLPTPSGLGTPRGSTLKGMARRLVAAVKWAAPVVTLALVPKCPMCVVGYITLLTGVGVSLSTAETLRWLAIWVSAAAIAWLVGRAVWRGVSARMGVGA